MAIKVLIKRNVTADRAKEMIPIFRKMRALAGQQVGYISGETLKRLDSPDQFLVISTWKSSKDWEAWVKTAQRQKIQTEIDLLLGGETIYEIYHYGFTE
jgi:heme-degrading monooxygenase HmoA